MCKYFNFLQKVQMSENAEHYHANWIVLRGHAFRIRYTDRKLNHQVLLPSFLNITRLGNLNKISKDLIFRNRLIPANWILKWKNDNCAP
jgi:hypothetical protein